MTTINQHPVRRVLPADPAAPARIGLLVILAFLAIVGAWGLYAPVSGAAIAAGNLQVEGQHQSVQHPDGGVVETLHVREGAAVQAGDVLMTLSSSEPAARLAILLAERDTLWAREARLLAERDGNAEPRLPDMRRIREDAPSLRQALDNERSVMEARARQFDVENDILGRRIVQLREIQAGVAAQVGGLEEQGALLGEEIAAAEQLLGSGHTTRARVRELENARAEIEAQRASRLSEIAGSEEAIGEAELELARSERTHLTEITAELQTVQSQIMEIDPRISAAEDVLARTEIRAPATGEVVGLTAFTIGGVVRPGDRVLDVVPSAGEMIVEARLHLADVQDVTPGRIADVQLVGINRADRPRIKGEVLTVSADRLTDERTGEGYYSVRVAMDEDDVRAAGIEFQSGMPAEIIMTTQSRTFVEYLVGPLLDEATRAFRED